MGGLAKKILDIHNSKTFYRKGKLVESFAKADNLSKDFDNVKSKLIKEIDTQANFMLNCIRELEDNLHIHYVECNGFSVLHDNVMGFDVAIHLLEKADENLLAEISNKYNCKLDFYDEIDNEFIYYLKMNDRFSITDIWN